MASTATATFQPVMAQKLEVKDLQADAAVAPSCDVALGFLATVERVDFTQEDARRVKRKIDLHLLPIVRTP